MDIKTMTDPEEIRLQRVLDEATQRIDDRESGRRTIAVAVSVGPFQKATPCVMGTDPIDLKSKNELYADREVARKSVRAYRASRGDYNA